LSSDQYIDHRETSSAKVYHRLGKIKTILIILLTSSFWVANAVDAFAYVDPNTGGYVFQLLFPVLSAAGLAYLFLKRQIKLLCVRIYSFVKRAFSVLISVRNDIKKGSE
jgi:hypothetical protein